MTPQQASRSVQITINKSNVRIEGQLIGYLALFGPSSYSRLLLVSTSPVPKRAQVNDAALSRLEASGAIRCANAAERNACRIRYERHTERMSERLRRAVAARNWELVHWLAARIASRCKQDFDLGSWYTLHA